MPLEPRDPRRDHPRALRSPAAGLLSAALAGGLCAAVLAPSPAAGSAAASDRASYQVLHATLRPGGDPDGTGTARFRLYPMRGKVCARVTWDRIDTPTAAHIHRRSDGMVKVDLTGSVTGGDNCATGVATRLVRRIADHPRRFYFNVHNETYPAGAIQGTLRR